MNRRRARRLILPAALALTSVSLVVACSDDEEELALCDDVSGDVCVFCVDDQGDRSCAGTPGCFYDEDQGVCDEAIA